MRRFLFPLASIALLPLVLTGAGIGCGGGGGGGGGGGDAGSDATADTLTMPTTSDAATDATSIVMDSGPPPVSCTAAPTFQAPISISHSPDKLRRVANGALGLLESGTLLITELEELDTSGRHGLFFRTLDTTTMGAMPSDPDQRLDSDGDNLSSGTPFNLVKLQPNLFALEYQASDGSGRLRAFWNGHWSPEMSTAMPFRYGEQLSYAVSPSGDILVSRAGGGTPATQAVLYSIASSSWGAPQKLDLAGETGAPTTYVYALADGRFLAVIWQGSGGPAIAVRTPSGAWQAASDKADTGGLSTYPDVRVMPDGTVLLTALESVASDTLRAMYATWSASSGWVPSRVLSKAADSGMTNAVLPVVHGVDPHIFPVDATTFDFVAFVSGGCTTPSSKCTFSAVSRRYSAGAWGPPTDLMLAGDTAGAGNLWVYATRGQPFLLRRAMDGTFAAISRQDGGSSFTAAGTPFDATVFPATLNITNFTFFGGQSTNWSFATRVTPGGTMTPDMPNPSAVGQLKLGTGIISNWQQVQEPSGAFWGDISTAFTFENPAGELTFLGANPYTNITGPSLELTHVPATGTLEEVHAVLNGGGEVSATAYPPSGALRSVDKGTLVEVAGNVAGDPDAGVTGGTQLRAYAWNGNGTNVAKQLAKTSDAPRPFSQGVLAFACGGAAFFAVDPADGSHSATLVLAQ